MKIKSSYLRSSIITPSVFLLGVIIYGISALKMAPIIVDRQLSESFFPILVTLLAIPTCITLIVSGIKEAKKDQKKEYEVKIPVKVVLVALLLGLFIFCFAHIGFTFSAPLFVFLFMLIYDDKPQKIVKKIILSLCIVAFVYILYEICFDVRFPEIWR